MLGLELGEIAIAVAAATGFLAFLLLALNKPAVAVAVLLGAWFVSTALRDSVDLSVFPAEIRIRLLDGLTVAMLAAATVRVASQGVRSVGHGIALALVGLAVLHLVRGAIASGLQVGVNDARLWLYFATAVLYGSTISRASIPTIWKLLIAAGVIVALTAIPYWATEGIGSSSGLLLRDGEFLSTRPISASGALVVLQALMLAIALRWPKGEWRVAVIALCSTAVLLLQHRTVWVAAILIGMGGFIAWALTYEKAKSATAFALTGVLLLALPVAAAAFVRTGNLVESVSETTRSTSTIAWRADGWGQLIDENEAPSTLLMGNPAGFDRTRFINGQDVEVSPHNGYLEAYLRSGLLAVLLLLGAWIVVWLRRSRVGAQAGISQTALGMLLITQIAFSAAYSLDAVQGLILGMLLGCLSVASPRQGRRGGTAITSA